MPIVQHQVAVVLVRGQRGRIGSVAARVHEVAAKQRTIDRQGHVETGKLSLPGLTETFGGALIVTAPFATSSAKRNVGFTV